MDSRIERCADELKQFILNSCGGMTRKPAGRLKHPYITPSSEDSPYYSDNLWDWDSWLAAIALMQAEADLGDDRFADFERGSALNFLELCATDGYMPICVTPDRDLNVPGLKDLRSTNMHKPVLCQLIASIVQKDSRNLDWLKPHVSKLEAFLHRYARDFTDAQTGLYRWKDDFAVGVDNDPAVFFRPANSCGSIYLNSLMYRELLAMGFLMEMLGDMEKANAWRLTANELRSAVNRYCWDERDGTYYSVDFCPSSSHEEGCIRRWNINTLRFVGEKGRLTGVEIQPIDWKPNPEGGRPLMVPAGEPELVKADIVLLAMGFLKPQLPEVGKNVFFAGDVQSGASLVVRAMASGHTAAESVDLYLRKTKK